MPLGRCIKGHMYKIERYGNKCPICDSPPVGAGEGAKSIPSFDPEKTKGIEGEGFGIEPVVGWLVCIEGEQKGKDYKIKQGKNFIGRSDEMDIAITGDDRISRKNHAAIVYDSKQLKFFLLPGEGSGLVYLSNQVKKDQAVFTPVEISAYDVIEIGKTKLIFINLCGIHFDWDKIEV